MKIFLEIIGFGTTSNLHGFGTSGSVSREANSTGSN